MKSRMAVAWPAVTRRKSVPFGKNLRMCRLAFSPEPFSQAA